METGERERNERREMNRFALTKDVQETGEGKCKEVAT